MFIVFKLFYVGNVSVFRLILHLKIYSFLTGIPLSSISGLGRIPRFLENTMPVVFSRLKLKPFLSTQLASLLTRNWTSLLQIDMLDDLKDIWMSSKYMELENVRRSTFPREFTFTINNKQLKTPP